MQTSRATLGATMIIVVLFTLLLLTVILASTVQMGLSSRHSTADQTATLAAQYNAESEMNTAKSQLRDMQILLSSKKVLNSVPAPATGGLIPMNTDPSNIDVPMGTGMSDIERVAAQFCGYSVDTLNNQDIWSKTKLPDKDSKGNPKYSNPLQCTVSQDSLKRFNPAVMARFVHPAAYALLPQTERPAVSASAAMTADARESSFNNWWVKKFAPQQVGENVAYQLQPTRVIKVNRDTFRFYFGVANFKVKSGNLKTAKAKRVLSGERSNKGEWWFQIYRPNLLDYMMLIDEQGTGAVTDVNIINQRFNGPVHTNGRFLFGPNASASFTGKLSSAGFDFSTGRPTDKRPAVNFTTNFDVALNRYRRKEITPNKDAKDVTTSLLNNMPSNANAMVRNIKNAIRNDSLEVDFEADQVQLPSTRQLPEKWAMAKSLGLIAAGSSNSITQLQDSGRQNSKSRITLFAGNGNGNPLNSYNTSTGNWQETPGDIFQYISICSDNLGVVNTCQNYRVDPLGRVFENTSRVPGIANWVKRKRGFSGVIYADEVTSLSGPARLNNDGTKLANVPPALASFSNITILSKGQRTLNGVNPGINITGDLTMSQTPCPLSSVDYKIACNKSAENMLGIFTQFGDISIDYWAPNDLNLHTAAVASSGVITARCYENNVSTTNKDCNNMRKPDGSIVSVSKGSSESKGARGDLHLIGSFVQNKYAPIGALYRDTMQGYGRQFHYDPRFARDKRPEGLPDSPSWNVIDASSDKGQIALENIVWRQANASDF